MHHDPARLAGRAQGIDPQPVVAVVAIRPVGGPLDAIGQRVAHMFFLEALDGRAFFGQPAGIVAAVGNDPEDVVNIGPCHQVDEWLDARRRIERVILAIDDVERLAGQIVEGQGVAHAARRIAQHGQVAYVGQECGPFGGLQKRKEIGAGAAVRNAGHRHAIVVHVISLLEQVEDGGDVVGLIVEPPERFVPGGRDHDDAAGFPQLLVAVAPECLASLGLRPADPAVQIELDRIGVARVIVVRHQHDIRKLRSLRIHATQLQLAGGHIPRPLRTCTQPFVQRGSIRGGFLQTLCSGCGVFGCGAPEAGDKCLGGIVYGHGGLALGEQHSGAQGKGEFYCCHGGIINQRPAAAKLSFLEHRD